MLLPTPELDDLRFQQIVDEAKRLIPKYCPEWTDHNVSDPGVALIELFAWMTDMLLYRVNKLPDRMYVKFLEIIGVTLDTARAAQVPVTFYLSAPLENDITIPQGTEVATPRTETNAAIVFTTEIERTIRTPQARALYTFNASHRDDAFTANDLRALDAANRGSIAMFPAQPGTGDAFCIALERDLSHHVLALIVDCTSAAGAGVDPDNPPIQWEVSQLGPNRWSRCDVEFDSTRGFNSPGENTIILHLPEMKEREMDGLPGVKAFWLQCRLTTPPGGSGQYVRSPELKRLRLESRGATVPARHGIVIHNETLGHSDGIPGQTFHLLNTPVLDLEPTTDYLEVEGPDGRRETWTYVSDFADSGPNDRHFTLDHLDGTLMLGPTLLQPDGTVYIFGRTPARDSLLTFTRYRYGGGVKGNVARGALTDLKSAIPYVSNVTNREAARGGRDAQTLDDAKLRAPQFLRTRTRAVTADDHEYLAQAVPGVARARCIAPGPKPGGPDDPKPGEVFVYVLPQADAVEGRIPPERLRLAVDLSQAVLNELEQRRLVGVSLSVREPQYVWVSVDATLRISDASDDYVYDEVRQRAEALLYAYLNPYIGGTAGTGWPFGRDLHISELFGLLQRIEAVEFVESVKITQSEPGQAGGTSVATRLRLQRHALICSDQHTVRVSKVGGTRNGNRSR